MMPTQLYSKGAHTQRRRQAKKGSGQKEEEWGKVQPGQHSHNALGPHPSPHSSLPAKPGTGLSPCLSCRAELGSLICEVQPSSAASLTLASLYFLFLAQLLSCKWLLPMPPSCLIMIFVFGLGPGISMPSRPSWALRMLPPPAGFPLFGLISLGDSRGHS